MNHFRVAMVGLIILATNIPAAPVPKAVPSDEEIILGIWKIVKVEGGDLPEENLKTIRFEFKKEGKVILTLGEEHSRSCTFKLDPKSTPKSMDLTPDKIEDFTERTMLWIYELDGDVLKICMSEGSNAVRPKEFKVVNKRDALVTLKRVEGK